MLAVTFWVLVLIVLPQLVMLDFSLRLDLPPARQGGPEDVWTLANYRYFLFGFPGNPDAWNYVDLAVFARTLVAAMFVTVFDLVICYPIAYYLAQSAQGQTARILAVALVVPYWVNEILRAFAFRIIFGSGGLINAALQALGLIDQPIDFIRADVALYAGLGYAYVLLMIFPIYNAIESLDRNQIEAARDLGASLVAHPLAGGDPVRQARHHLGLHHGLHAVGGRPRRPADPGRPVLLVVHPDHLPDLLRERELAARAPPTP